MKSYFFVALTLGLVAPAQADEKSERVVDRIHSQLPLYTFDWDQLWPRSFSDGESFGCTSRVPDGDWRFVPDNANGNEDELWQRFANYGVFHCAAIIRSADTRPELDSASYEYGFFVRLGNASIGRVKWEIWALQLGINPGSDYVLMAREAARKGLIEDFVLLQQRCPTRSTLEAKNMDVWNTRYCSVNSREELLSLGRQMLRLPARGNLTRVAPAE